MKAVLNLNNSPVIWALAKDLGIEKVRSPVEDILKYCERKIKKILKEFPDCKTLSNLLDCVAAKLNTEFYEIRSDEELISLQLNFANKGEKIFANLKNELSDEVLGITFKRTHRDSWEKEFVSVIDCRGNKAFRSYFTKWHEIAHLLALTDQQRLKFFRTNLQPLNIDPEERLVDIIAGRFGFYPPFIQKNASDCGLSFEKIDKLSAELCPESSFHASLIGFVQAWPDPCILLYCELAFKSNELPIANQQGFDFIEEPTPYLRATKVTPNQAAKDYPFRIHRNMRVPQSSVIYKLHEGYGDLAEAEENLSHWETSDGKKLNNIQVTAKVKRYGSGIFALISPIES